jgi:hypothetical protein
MRTDDADLRVFLHMGKVQSQVMRSQGLHEHTLTLYPHTAPYTLRHTLYALHSHYTPYRTHSTLYPYRRRSAKLSLLTPLSAPSKRGRCAAYMKGCVYCALLVLYTVCLAYLYCTKCLLILY